MYREHEYRPSSENQGVCHNQNLSPGETAPIRKIGEGFLIEPVYHGKKGLDSSLIVGSVMGGLGWGMLIYYNVVEPWLERYLATNGK